MSQGDELGVVEEWIDATLRDDTTLATLLAEAGGSGPYLAEAPEEATNPVVVFQHQGGPAGGGAVDLGATLDVNPVGPGRVAVESTWVVKVIGDGLSALPLRPIVNRMDALLADATGATDTGEVLACKRIGPVSYPSVEPGNRRFRHRGGLYRIWSTAEEA